MGLKALFITIPLTNIPLTLPPLMKFEACLHTIAASAFAATASPFAETATADKTGDEAATEGAEKR